MKINSKESVKSLVGFDENCDLDVWIILDFWIYFRFPIPTSYVNTLCYTVLY